MSIEGMKDWPEPVIRVQALSESGMSQIPDCYIMPESDRPSLHSTNSAKLNVPLIDLSTILYGTDDERANALVLMSKACREWGFFQLSNHGVSHELMDRMRETWREFFHLPVEAKEAYANDPKTHEGYGSRVGVKKGAILDWHDYYFLHYLPLSLKDTNKWPSLPSSCRDVIDEYSDQLVKLGEKLLKVLSMNLGLEEDYLQNAFGGKEDIGACLSINYYPKCPEPELTLGLTSHSDPGGITILLPDDHVPGLQVPVDGSWITVKSVPNAFIVNIGDQIQILSNATYKSAEHRVIANADKERISVALFYNPKSDIPIEPAKQLLKSDEPASYSPLTFEEYRLFMMSKGPQGKLQVESLLSSK